MAHLSATSASCDLIPCFIKRFLTALSCSGSKDAPSINPRASWRRLEALSAGPVERKPCVCQAVGSEKMGRLNSPSDPHLSHGKRFYRPNKGEVGRTLKHFAQCTSIGRKRLFYLPWLMAHTAHQRLQSYQVSAVHNQTAAKARSHAPIITASPLAIINSISRLLFLFRSISFLAAVR